MLFSKSLLLGAVALVSSAAAQGQLALTTTFKEVKAGETVPITYSGGSGPVEISLRKGESNNLGAPTVITSSATGGSYSWSVPSSLESGTDYALQIKQGDTVNYAGPFAVSGGSGTASSASSSAASSASKSASSVISSAVSSATASLSSSLRNMTMTTTTGGNSTVSSATLTSTDSTAAETATETASTTTTDGSSPTESAADAGSSASASAAPTSGAMSIGVASPLALILSAVAAMIYLK